MGDRWWSRRARLLGVLLPLFLLLACDPSAASPGGTSAPGTATAPAVTATASPPPYPTAEPTPRPDLPAFPTEDGDWSNANGGHANTRARESAITEATVQRLGEAWAVPIHGIGPYGGAAGAPVVQGGVVYLEDLQSNVMAIDLRTGEALWRYEVGIPVSGPNGPAVGGGYVVASAGGRTVMALDSTTGDLAWQADLALDGFQPHIAGDVVLVGTGSLAHVAGNSGVIYALELETGAPRWKFQVVEEGFWGNPDVNSGGGVWGTPAVDLERGVAYFGTGNAGPYPGTVDYPNASSRPGDNLYTSSLIALDLETGELRWHHQAAPHGLFDHDFQASPLLATLDGGPDAEGGPRQVVIGSGKLGRVLAVDVDTQEVVWDTPVGVHQNDDLREIPPGEVVEVYPGIFGGVETPMAATGDRVFAAVVNLPTRHSATGHGALDGSSALLNAGDRTAIRDGTGELVALDAETGEVLWSVTLDSPPFGGATVVGDLVFTATFAGVISAHRVQDGAEVWRMEAGGGINAWPAVQDDTILWPIGLGGAPRLLALRLAE